MDTEGLPSGAGPCSRLYLRITSLCASGLLVSAGSFSPSLSSSKLPPPPTSAPQPWGCDCTRRRAPGSSSAMQNTNVGGPSTRQHTHTHTLGWAPLSPLSRGSFLFSCPTHPQGGFRELSTGQGWRHHAMAREEAQIHGVHPPAEWPWSLTSWHTRYWSMAQTVGT